MSSGTGMPIISILLGIAAGAVGFVPLFVVARVRNVFVREHDVQFGIVGIGVSLVLMFVVFFVCSRVAPDSLPYLGASAIVAFLCMTMVYAIRHVWHR